MSAETEVVRPSGLCDPLQIDPPSKSIRSTRVIRAPGRIVRHTALTHDTWEVVVETHRDYPRIVAMAGQFATIKVDGISHPRAYSFARDPASEGERRHTFFIREVPNGEMSAWLRQSRVDESVELAGPLGHFVLDRSSRTLLLVAGGSGVSAVKALAEHAVRIPVTRDCVVLLGARTARDLHSLETFSSIARSWREGYRFEFVPVLSDEPAQSAWDGARGLVGDFMMNSYLANERLSASTLSAWLCGPPPMIDACASLLTQVGVPEEHIHRDAFEDRRSPAPKIHDRSCVLCDECLLVRPVADCIVEAGRVRRDERGDIIGYSPLTPLRTAGLYYSALIVDHNVCIRCLSCVNACPHGAITVG